MTEVSKTTPILDGDETLSGIKSFEDALQVLKDAGVGVVSYAEEFGTGFDILPDRNKDTLVGNPFVIVNVRFSEGDHGEFVSLHVVTKSGEKWIVNDGSTGIYAQCKSARKNLAGAFMDKGLRRSDYDYVNVKTGEKTAAKTYYLA